MTTSKNWPWPDSPREMTISGLRERLTLLEGARDLVRQAYQRRQSFRNIILEEIGEKISETERLLRSKEHFALYGGALVETRP